MISKQLTWISSVMLWASVPHPAIELNVRIFNHYLFASKYRVTLSFTDITSCIHRSGTTPWVAPGQYECRSAPINEETNVPQRQPLSTSRCEQLACRQTGVGSSAHHLKLQIMLALDQLHWNNPLGDSQFVALMLLSSAGFWNVLESGACGPRGGSLRRREPGLFWLAGLSLFVVLVCLPFMFFFFFSILFAFWVVLPFFVVIYLICLPVI